MAFVGGSLVPAGGHNPLEPAQFAVPIVMGPHYANFRAITGDLLAHDAVHIATQDEPLRSPDRPVAELCRRQSMGERARQVFNQQAGATERCADALRELLSPGSNPERPA